MNIKNYKAPKINAKIPTNFEARVSDYHEFSNIKYLLEKTLGLKYKFEEVGCDGMYYAVFWMGKKPSKLIKATKQTFEETIGAKK